MITAITTNTRYLPVQVSVLSITKSNDVTHIYSIHNQ